MRKSLFALALISALPMAANAGDISYNYAELGYSQIDIKAPDLAKFPRFAEVRAAEVILGPGDLLYVPARWWHSVQSLDVSISINQWFCTEA